MAYEISKELDYHEVARQTPLAVHRGRSLTGSPGLVCILRASLPFFQGFLNYYDQSDSGFIGAYRKVAEDHEFDISIDYLATASIDGKTLIIADPMLATGKSLLDAITLLKERGEPRHIHLASVIAAQPGVDYLSEHLGADCTLWTAALDSELDDHYYIVPGLGDAGDLAYGNKL